MGQGWDLRAREAAGQNVAAWNAHGYFWMPFFAAAMLGFLHVIHLKSGVCFQGYLSYSQDLKFSDMPTGCFSSLEALPTLGALRHVRCNPWSDAADVHATCEVQSYRRAQ